MFTIHKLFIKLLNGIVMILWLLPCSSQSSSNLVPNYSFEITTTCSPNGMTNVFPWKQLSTSTFKSLDYENKCFQNSCCGVPYNIFNYGFQYARTGNGYVIIYLMYENDIHRGYLNVELIDSLTNDHCYYVEFFVNLVNVSQFSINNIALLLSKTEPVQGNIDTPILANPQIINYGNPVFPLDTVSWVKVSGIYRAAGGEKYITIGNFKKDADTDTKNTNFPNALKRGEFYIDDVSVIPLDSINLKADAGPDTTITIGDSVFIGTLLGGNITTTWYNIAGQPIANNVPGLYVSPTQNTWYMLEQNLCGNVSRDTVNVTVNLLPLKWLGFSLTPGPYPWGEERKTTMLRWHTANEFNVSHYNIQRSYRGADVFENIGSVTADNKAYNAYSFVDDKVNGAAPWALYRIQGIDKDGQRSYSEVRRLRFDNIAAPLRIYPNPAKRIITVAYPNLKEVIISDVAGRVMLQDIFNAAESVQINVGNLPKGIFILKATNINGDVETQKLVVE